MSGEAAAAAPPRPPMHRLVLKHADSLGVALFLVALLIYFTLSTDTFLTSSNWSTLLGNVAAIGLVAIGQTLVMVAGGFDLSVAGVAPLAAVLYAKLTNGGTPPAAALLLVLVIGAAVGGTNALLITRARINPLITTLATLSIAGGVAYVLTNGQSIPLDNPGAGFLAEPAIGSYAMAVVLWIAVVLAGIAVLRYTVVGRALYAVGGNPEASWLAGMPVRAITGGAYAVCSLLAALAGVIAASDLLAADGSIGSDTALLSIAAVVLGGGALTGGHGSIGGTLIGVLILGVLQNGLVLMQVNSFYQEIATGVVLLLAVGIGQSRRLRGPTS